MISGSSDDASLCILPAGKRPEKIKLGTLRIDVADVVRNKSFLTPGPCKRQKQASSNLSWSGWQLRLMMFRLNHVAPTLVPQQDCASHYKLY